jgi:hypothetical protein
MHRRDDRRDAGKMHRRNPQRRTCTCYKAAAYARRAAKPAEHGPENPDRNGDRQDRQCGIETDRHSAVISQHRDEMGGPHRRALGHRRDGEPVAAPRLDAEASTFQDDEKANISKEANQRRDQNETIVMLLRDALEYPEHQAITPSIHVPRDPE